MNEWKFVIIDFYAAYIVFGEHGDSKAYLEENWILHFKLLLAKRTLKVCSDHRKYMQFKGS